MNDTVLRMKMTAKAVLMVLLLSAAGMTKANAQTGALNGLFSVNDSTQVRFSQGNLQYQASTNTWQFAENQWNYVGEANSNISETYDGWIDLFGWGTGNNPTNTSEDSADYPEPFNDWGNNAISNGGNTANSGWSTLTNAEWRYVFNTRTGDRYAKASVAGVSGVILLPDDWDDSTYTLSSTNIADANYSSNIISDTDWPMLEAAGAVFLPAAGYRDGTTVFDAGSYGIYWSASPYGSTNAYGMDFDDGGLRLGTCGNRHGGFSVRLVCPAENYTFGITATANPAEGGTVSGSGSYAEGAGCTLTATASAGWSFQNWTENGEVVSVENPYTFTVAGERNLVANFVESSTHWTPNNTDYEENMPVTAVVEIDGVEQQSATLELGAFSGEECRGSQTPLYFGPTQRYVYQMTVFGEEGDEIAFRLYDHATNEELELVAPEPVAFDILGYGTLPNPVVLNFRHSYAITATANPEEGGTVNGGGTYIHGETCTLTATPNDGYVFVHWTLDGEVVSTEAEYTFEVTGAGEYTAHFNLVQTTTFNQGWNWWSSYVELNGSYGLEALENGLDANGVMIKSQNDGYVSYSEELGWYGSLVELYNEQSYRVKADAACTVQLQGSLTNPADHPVTLNPGWTWMGFPWNQAMSVEAALEGFEPEANDFIKGRNAYTMYYAENGYSMWFGPLNSLEPGQGYVYYSNSDEAKTLTFNTNGGRSAQPNVTADDNLFRPETGNYADNMTLTAVVSLNGKELRSEDYEVAAFCNGECRGSAKLAYFAPKDSYVAFLTLYGNDGDELELVLTDGTTTACQGDALRFDADGRIGTLSEPHKLSFGATGIDDHGAARVSVYPNPTKDVFNVEGEGIRRVDVFNAFGQEVLVEETTKEAFRIDLSDKAAGVYMLRVVTESGVMTRQLVKE